MNEWVKVRHTLFRDVKIRILARLLHCNKITAFGIAVAWLSFVDERTKDGQTHLSIEELTEELGFNGAVEALAAIGWAAIDGDGCVVAVDFDKHCGEAAKRREFDALTMEQDKQRRENAAQRVSRFRARQKENDPCNVTSALHERYTGVTCNVTQALHERYTGVTCNVTGDEIAEETPAQSVEASTLRAPHQRAEEATPSSLMPLFSLGVDKDKKEKRQERKVPPDPPKERKEINKEKKDITHTTAPAYTHARATAAGRVLPRSVSEVLGYMHNMIFCGLHGLEAEQCARKFYDSGEECGWLTKSGLPITDWRASCRKWVQCWQLNRHARYDASSINSGNNYNLNIE